MADGGDGTLDAAVAAGFTRVEVRAQGPTGEPVTTAFAARDGVAVVEMADVSGLALLHARPARRAGRELVRHRRGDRGPRSTTAAGRSCWASAAARAPTAGRGMLQALGARLLDADGRRAGAGRRRARRPGPPGPLRPAPGARRDRGWSWRATSTTRCSAPTAPPRCTGRRRAPTPTDVATLDAALARWADVVEAAVAAGSPECTLLQPAQECHLLQPRRRRRCGPARRGRGGRRRVRGAWPCSAPSCSRASASSSTSSGSPSTCPGAGLVVTGEGSLDAQTLSGKAPAGVAAAAKEAGIPVVTVSGRVELTADQLARAGIRRAYALTDIESDPERCFTEAGPLLRGARPHPRRRMAQGGQMTITVPLFVNGDGMRGGRVHHTIEAHPFLGAARTAPRYRFFSVRDEFPALWPVAEDGVSIEGELYDVPLDVIRDALHPRRAARAGARRRRAGGRQQRARRGAARGRPRRGPRAQGRLRARRLAGLQGGRPLMDFVIRARRVLTPAGETAAAVVVRDGVIAAVEPYDAARREAVDLADDEVLLPGLVDTHVHVNEPGRTEWEGFATATRAAAAGGVTTLLDMPLNSIPPTCTVDALQIKRKAADGRCHVDVGFWGGAIPGNVDDLRGLHDEGVFGFKCFLAPSGVDEFPPLPVAELERYLAELAGFGAHDDRARRGRRRAGARARRAAGGSTPTSSPPARAASRTSRSRSSSRPPGTPAAAVHLLHLSSSDAVPMLRSARRDGIAITVETCPHYLVFEAASIADGRHPVQVLPADPRGRQPRGPVGGAGPRRHRLRRLRPLALRPRAEGPRPRRLRHGVGRHLVPADRPARRLDRGAAARARPRRRRALDGATPRRDRGPRPQGPDRARLRRRPRRVRAGRGVRRRPGAALPPQPGHALRRPRPRGRGAAHLAARRAGRPTASRAVA